VLLFVPVIKPFCRNIIINHGGLNEWKREKYSKFQKFLAKMGHKYGAKWATSNIADNNLLKESIKDEFDVDAHVIRYGGNHAIKPKITENLIEKYPFLKQDYYVNVSRAQIDNNLHIVLSAFSKMPDKLLIMVSNWNISEYGRKLKSEFKDKYSNLILLDAIYESIEINSIRAYSKVYIHSHSYCGTSPSLVEAMSLKLPIVSFDVPTNRETTQNKAIYFSDSDELIFKIKNINQTELKLNSEKMFKIANENYTWEKICKEYSELFEK
jgi:glycosyltransferase involved in cell wall biosynthesis